MNLAEFTELKAKLADLEARVAAIERKEWVPEAVGFNRPRPTLGLPKKS